MLRITSVKTADVQKTNQSTDKQGSYCIFEIHTCNVVKDLSTYWQERLDLCSCNCCISGVAGEDSPYIILSSSGFSIFRDHLTLTGGALSPHSLCKCSQPPSYLCQLTAGPVSTLASEYLVKAQPPLWASCYWDHSPGFQWQNFLPEVHGKEIMFTYLLTCTYK